MEQGKWIEIAHPFIVRATLIATSGYIGWKIGSWIADLPVPNLIDAYEWDVKFGNAFVPSSWDWRTTEAYKKRIDEDKKYKKKK